MRSVKITRRLSAKFKALTIYMDQGTNSDKHSSNEFLISVWHRRKVVIQIPLLISIILNNLLTSNTVFTIYMATVRQRKPLSSSRSNKAVVTVDPVCHPFHLIPALGCTNNVIFFASSNDFHSFLFTMINV